MLDSNLLIKSKQDKMGLFSWLKKTGANASNAAGDAANSAKNAANDATEAANEAFEAKLAGQK